MANHLSEYKNKGKTPDVCRTQRQTSMIAFRKQKRKEYIDVNHRQNDVVDTSDIETIIVDGHKYIKEFPVYAFPIPVGSGHRCENCVEYGCIDDILIGFCYNCMLYKSSPDMWNNGNNVINLEIDDYKIPSYVTEKHAEIIYQWALQQSVNDEYPGLEVCPGLEVPENPTPTWQPQPIIQSPLWQPTPTPTATAQSLWQPTPPTQSPTQAPLWQSTPTTQAPVWLPTPTTQAPTTQAPLWQSTPTTQAPVWLPTTQAQPPAQPQPQPPTQTTQSPPKPIIKDWSFMYI